MSYKLGWGDKIGIAIVAAMAALAAALAAYDVAAALDLWIAS